MSTLFAVYSTKGCVGRCDARCYQAIPWTGNGKVTCTCICGGRNHGVGREHVSTEMDQSKVEAFREGRPDLEDDVLVVINRLVITDAKRAREHAYLQLTQLDLFEERVA